MMHCTDVCMLCAHDELQGEAGVRVQPGVSEQVEQEEEVLAVLGVERAPQRAALPLHRLDRRQKSGHRP